MASLGLIRVVPDSQLQQQDARDEELRQQAAEQDNISVLRGLSKHVMDAWTDAKQAKMDVLPRLQKSHRARAGVYDPTKLAQIRDFGGSELYLRVIANKCRILESWLKDVYLGQTDKPWTLKPTEKPELTGDTVAEVTQQLSNELAAVYAQLGTVPDQTIVLAAKTDMQEAAEERIRDAARKAVGRMERKMADQLSEGGFDHALEEFLADLVVYPAAILKGPVMRKKKRISWEKNAGSTQPAVVEEVFPHVERVCPFRAYPAPGADSPQDGYFIEHVTYTYEDLYAMLGTPGVNDVSLRAVLADARSGKYSDWLGFTSPDIVPDRDTTATTLKRKVFNIDALLYTGPVRSRDLRDWGMEEDLTDDPDATHEAIMLLIGEHVVKAHLNYDPVGLRPYYKASYQNVPGQFWAEGVPDVLEDIGEVVSAAGRALVNNMAMASGPQVGVNVDRLKTGETLNTLKPWALWQLEDSPHGNTQDRPLEFFQPQMHAQELLMIIEKFYQFADDFSMIPRYMAGSDKVAGAGRTASGLSMLMDAANKGLKNCVKNVDSVLSGLLARLYNHNMMFDPDETLKGDAQVVARGATSLMQLESLRLRRNEFLQATANPIDAQIVGIPGRAEILRETAKDLNMDTTRIVPPREQLMRAAQTPAPPAPQGGSPVLTRESLGNGAATTDNFSKNSMTPQ